MAGKNRDATPDPVIDDGEPDPDTLEFGEAGDLEDGASHEGIGRRASGHPADREHGMTTRTRSQQSVSGRPHAS